jgi:putative (di)nucleoside polyphosphate hydrolase
MRIAGHEETFLALAVLQQTTLELWGCVTHNAASSDRIGQYHRLTQIAQAFHRHWVAFCGGASMLLTCHPKRSGSCVMTPQEIEKLPYRPCAGVMLLNAEGQVFVGQRKDRYKDAWQMPQGGVEKGEDPAEAALRELEEETGVSRDLVTVLAETKGWVPYELPHELVPQLWKGKFRGQEQKWYLMRFHGHDDQVNIETEHQEFSAWKWMPVHDLVASIVPFKRSVYEAVLSEFEEFL